MKVGSDAAARPVSRPAVRFDRGPTTPAPAALPILPGPTAANLAGQPSHGSDLFLFSMATSPLAAPPAVNPPGANYPLTGSEAFGQAGGLRGSSGQDVLVGGEGSDVVLGGQARDLLIGGFAHTGGVQSGDQGPSGGSLDAHAEAVRQVVSEQSATDFFGTHAGLSAEDGIGQANEQALVDLWAMVGVGLDGAAGMDQLDAEA
jgi:hypothetical protein